MWKVKEIKKTGRMALKQNYWLGVLVVVICCMAATGLAGTLCATSLMDDFQDEIVKTLNYMYSPYSFYGLSIGAIIAIVLGILFIALVITAIAITETVCITIPVEVGACKYYLESNKGNADSSNVMFAFKKGQFGSIVKAVFLQGLFTFLWSLLLVIPGIVKAYQWRLVPYIMAENPNMNAKEARMLSKRLMAGNKWHTFGFDLSFIGWHILSVLTCGILYLFWTIPFICHSDAALYQKIVALDTEAKMAQEAQESKESKKGAKAPVKKIEEKKTTSKKAAVTKEVKEVKAEQKPAAKKPATKKPAAKKPAEKKAPAKKTASKKTTK